MSQFRVKLIFPIVISALGGGILTFSEFDDSPGGQLIGIILIISSYFLLLKLAIKKNKNLKK